MRSSPFYTTLRLSDGARGQLTSTTKTADPDPHPMLGAGVSPEPYAYSLRVYRVDMKNWRPNRDVLLAFRRFDDCQGLPELVNASRLLSAGDPAAARRYLSVAGASGAPWLKLLGGAS